jgi:phosphoserine phosphatase
VTGSQRRQQGGVPGLGIVVGLALTLTAGCADTGRDPLPSWNPGASKQAIIEFVTSVTEPGNPEYVRPPQRIAVLDNDGTLLTERPLPLQFEFMFDRIRSLAPENPEWATTHPYRPVLENDIQALQKLKYTDRRTIGTAAQTGMTQQEFDAMAGAFVQGSRHPGFDRRFVELVYQPMLELVSYLQANSFKVFIVTGGGIEFTRAYATQAYGIPAENIIGSNRELDLREQDGRLVLFRKPALPSVNAGRYKPVNIRLHTGGRPILAIGNSDGDLEMLRFVAENPQPSLVLLLDHDDADREFSYSEGADRVRQMARELDWPVISMRDDFRTLFPAGPRR